MRVRPASERASDCLLPNGLPSLACSLAARLSATRNSLEANQAPLTSYLSRPPSRARSLSLSMAFILFGGHLALATRACRQASKQGPAHLSQRRLAAERGPSEPDYDSGRRCCTGRAASDAPLHERLRLSSCEISVDARLDRQSALKSIQLCRHRRTNAAVAAAGYLLPSRLTCDAS